MSVGSPIGSPQVKGKQNDMYPFTACNVVPLIVLTIAETPMASNKVLHQILEPYGKPYCCFMDAILQKARVTARRLIFCNPEGQGQKKRLPSMYNRLVTYCSFHRHQNIIKMCGGGSGKTANSALWTYKNKLMHCWLWHTKEIQYLNSLSDKSQYLAARCAMADEIYMHHRSSPGAVESMNKVNKEMRTRRDVEPLVATSLLKIDSANRSRRPGVEILS